MEHAGLRNEDIEKLRKNLKVGQKIKCEITKYEFKKNGTTAKKELIEAVVVEKYPYVVQVVPTTEISRKILTVTYAEILMREREQMEK